MPRCVISPAYKGVSSFGVLNKSLSMMMSATYHDWQDYYSDNSPLSFDDYALKRIVNRMVELTANHHSKLHTIESPEMRKLAEMDHQQEMERMKRRLRDVLISFDRDRESRAVPQRTEDTIGDAIMRSAALTIIISFLIKTVVYIWIFRAFRRHGQNVTQPLLNAQAGRSVGVANLSIPVSPDRYGEGAPGSARIYLLYNTMQPSSQQQESPY